MTTRNCIVKNLSGGAGLAWFLTGTAAIAAPPTVDPCSLLTKSEIEQVISKLAGNPVAEREGDARWCNYEFADGKNALEVWVLPAAAMERAHKKAKHPTPVKDLGQEAFLDRKTEGLDYINLFVKKKDVTVELSLKETAGDEEKLKTLAQKAAGRF